MSGRPAPALRLAEGIAAAVVAAVLRLVHCNND